MTAYKARGSLDKSRKRPSSERRIRASSPVTKSVRPQARSNKVSPVISATGGGCRCLFAQSETKEPIVWRCGSRSDRIRGRWKGPPHPSMVGRDGRRWRFAKKHRRVDRGSSNIGCTLVHRKGRSGISSSGVHRADMVVMRGWPDHRRGTIGFTASVKARIKRIARSKQRSK